MSKLLKQPQWLQGELLKASVAGMDISLESHFNIGSVRSPPKLPNKHYNGHHRATEKEGDQRTLGEEVSWLFQMWKTWQFGFPLCVVAEQYKLHSKSN